MDPQVVMEETIGQYLRRKREERSISLEAVASQTRIQAGFLEAIEEDRFANIPHSVSAKGFIRSYARFLQLDPTEALKRCSALGPPEPAPVKQPDLYKEPLVDMGQIGKPTSRSVSFYRFLKASLQAVAVALSLALLLAWLAYRNRIPVPIQTDSERGLPSVRSSVPPLPAPPSPKTEEAPIASLPSSKQDVSPAVNTPVLLPTLRPVVEKGISSTVSVAPPRLSPRVFAPEMVAPSGAALFSRLGETGRPLDTLPPPQNRAGDPVIQNPLVLSLKANATTWVRVVIDQRTTRDVLLQPGDKVTWRGSEAFLLTVGNAGGVRVFLNEEDLGVLGDSGEVVRDRLLTRLSVEQHEQEEPF